MREAPTPPRFPSKVGVWWSSHSLTTGDSVTVAREIERLGYGSLFFGEGAGKESLVQAACYLAATDRLVIGTGIANIYLRHPSLAEGGSRSLGAMYPGRFVLGLGVSHQKVLSSRFGVAAGKQFSTMVDYLTQMDEVPDDVEPGASRPARVLAALGPKMLELARDKADGAHPYLVTADHTRTARQILGPGKLLIPEQAVAIGGDAADQYRRAEAHVRFYTGMQNYRQSWLRQGFTEADAEGSERLVTSLVGMGAAEHAAETVRGHLAAGADHVVIQVLRHEDADDPLPQLAAMAEALEL